MSAVTPWIRSGLTVAANAMRDPSGDQEKEPTLKSLPFVRAFPLTARLQGLGDVERAEVGVGVVAVDDLEVAEVLLAVLRRPARPARAP